MMVKLWPSETLEERAAYKAQVVVPFAAAVAKRLTSQVWDYSSRDLFAIASSFARAKLGHVQEVHDFAVALLNAPSNGSLTSQDSMNLVFLMNSGKQKFQARSMPCLPSLSVSRLDHFLKGCETCFGTPHSSECHPVLAFWPGRPSAHSDGAW